MIMLKMLLGVMTLVAVMVIMLVDDNVEDVVRGDDIGGNDGDNSEDDNGEDVVRSDDIGGSDGNNVDR